ncbi:MAG: AMP-binding protein [Alphaproteobacteria bacterium]
MHPGIHAAQTPDKPAYIMANSGRAVSYKALNDASCRMAQMLTSLGLTYGESIAIFMENNEHYFPLCWGAHRAGLYYTCISSYLTAPEIDYILRDCGARAVFTTAARAEVSEKLLPLLDGIEHRFAVGGDLPGYQRYETAVANYPAEPLAQEWEGSDMLYSSGTTGRPKGIKIALKDEPFGTPGTLLDLTRKLYGMDENVVYLSPAPLYHAAPLRFNLAVQRLGGTCIVMEHFDAEQALALIQKHRCTHSQWVPTHFVRMLKLPAEARETYDVSSMRVAIHAAAPCPAQVKQQMIEWWGPVLFEYYAGTEGNGFVAIGSKDWLEHKGSVGRALVGVLHIVDDEGNELPPGEAGTIYFADGNEFAYHNDPEKTAASRNEKGWSTLGDVGYVDADGWLYLTDRKAYMIISGGVNIYPQEVENLLVTHPAVLDCAIIGVPHDEFGEEVKAVVQPVEGVEPGPGLAEELIAFCRAELSRVKCPRSVDFVDELPRHANGKLYKRLVRDRYWGKESRIV